MQTFMIALGDELRAVRKRRKWTRRDVQRRLPFELSLQTIATWELGTRHIPAERLYLLCNVLGERVEDILPRVRKHIESTPSADLCLDIEAAARTTRDQLGPIRAWARCKLREYPTGTDREAR